LFLKYIILESVRDSRRNVKQNNVADCCLDFVFRDMTGKMDAAGFSETSELNYSNTDRQNPQDVKYQH
jgi:hypothetical protein